MPGASLLPAYISSRYDLRALAASTGIPITDLLAWLNEPETQAALDQLRSALEQSLELRALEARRTAIDALESVLRTTTDLVEKRRAAQTVLRALSRARGTSGERTQSLAREHHRNRRSSRPASTAQQRDSTPLHGPDPTPFTGPRAPQAQAEQANDRDTSPSTPRQHDSMPPHRPDHNALATPPLPAPVCNRRAAGRDAPTTTQTQRCAHTSQRSRFAHHRSARHTLTTCGSAPDPPNAGFR